MQIEPFQISLDVSEYYQIIAFLQETHKYRPPQVASSTPVSYYMQFLKICKLRLRVCSLFICWSYCVRLSMRFYSYEILQFLWHTYVSASLVLAFLYLASKLLPKNRVNFCLMYFRRFIFSKFQQLRIDDVSMEAVQEDSTAPPKSILKPASFSLQVFLRIFYFPMIYPGICISVGKDNSCCSWR